MLDNKTIETLKSLGLTQLQAKLYVSLAKMGTVTIKSVAVASDIARQDVYRLIESLLKLGLAEKILNNPTMYKATPLKEGVNLLLDNKKKEYIKLHKNTAEMVKKLNAIDFNLSRQKEEETFVITTSKTLVFKRFKEQDTLTKKTIDAIGEWKVTRTRFYDCFEDYLDLLKRGVRIRTITEKHEEEHVLTEKMKFLQSNPLFEIKYLSTPAPVNMAIYDKKAVQLCVSPSEDNYQDLGSKNPQLMKIINAFFEELWEKAETKNKTTCIEKRMAPIKQ